MSDGYADLLRSLLPGAVVDICYPADPGANLPIGGLEGYDGVAITGSALNVYDRGPEIDRQIELAREVLKSRTPLFGSCWGLQVITVAAGGVVRANPKGREIGIGRKIALTPAGRDHPMYRRQGLGVRRRHGASRRGRDARARHHRAGGERHVRRAGGRDPGRRRGRLGGAVSPGVLARRHGGDHAALRPAADPRRLLRRCGRTRDAYVADLDALDREPDNKPLAWRYGIDESVLDPAVRTTELANWIAHQVLPTRGGTGTIMNFRGRHVVVTGGTGALGTAVVGALLEAGAVCHVPYRSEDEAKRFPHRGHAACRWWRSATSPTRRR